MNNTKYKISLKLLQNKMQILMAIRHIGQKCTVCTGFNKICTYGLCCTFTQMF